MLNFELGSEVDVAGRRHILTQAGAVGHAVFGPYRQLAPGRYSVTFMIGRADEQPVPDQACGLLDVTGHGGKQTFARKELRLGQLSVRITPLTLTFDLREPCVLEYRVAVRGETALLIEDDPRVIRVGEAPPAADAAPSGFPDPDVLPKPTLFLDCLADFRRLYEHGAVIDDMGEDRIALTVAGKRIDVASRADIEAAEALLGGRTAEPQAARSERQERAAVPADNRDEWSRAGGVVQEAGWNRSQDAGPVEELQLREACLIFGSVGTPSIIDGKACQVTRKGDGGTIMYGPYEERQSGRYRVEFELGLADDTAPMGDPVCATLEVATNDGATHLAEKFILHSQLRRGLASAAVEFTLPEPRTLEYRVQSSGQAPLAVAGKVRVTPLPDRKVAPAPRGSAQREWENERELLDGFLRNVSGLVHVGANLGQERRYYWLFGIDVIWVEPIREIYDRMVDNIARYPRQRPINALLTEREGEEIEFRIANNNGASSSILPFEDHALLYPDIEYVEHRKIISTTLAALMRREGISTDHYQALTLDVEGAELMVLKGAGDALRGFRYVKCEAADFPARTGTPTVAELDAFLTAAGFSQIVRRPFGTGPGNEGTYWDVVWKRVSPGEPLHEPGIALPVIVNALEVEGVEKCE